MKFLLVTRDFPPPVTDGMMRYAESLASGLSKIGHKVVVLSGCSENFSDRRAVRREGYLLYRYKSVNKLKYRPEPWRRFARTIDAITRRHSIDRIVIQHPYHAPGAIHVREHLRCPIIYITHTVSAHERVMCSSDPSYRHDLPNEERERKAVNSADAVICLSESQKANIISLYGVSPERLHVVPTGVPVMKPAALSSMPSHLSRLKSKGKKLILYVGRESWEKGTDLMPEIIQGVADLTEMAVFVLIGIDRRRWFRYLLPPRTYMMPWLDGSELTALYRLCHVLIVPSRRDSMPYVLLEAMANGIVPVVTDVDGPAEIVEHGYSGLKAKVNRESGRVIVDTAALSASIASLIMDNNLLERLRFRATEVIKDGHIMELQLNRFVEVAADLV